MEKGFYEFGHFRVDLQQKVLLKKGQLVRIGKRTFDVLLVLLSEHGTVILKNDIVKRAWNGAAVSDGALSVQINALRAALGDGNPPRYIETFRGRGFKFISDVTFVSVKADGTNQAAAAYDISQGGCNTPTELPVAVQPSLIEEPAVEDKQNWGVVGASLPNGKAEATQHGSRAILRWSALAIGLATLLFGGLDATQHRTKAAAWPLDLVLIFFGCVSLYVYRKLPKAAFLIEAEPPEGSAFRGLLSFDSRDAARFYGRDIEIDALFDLVSHADFRFGPLYGESGAGKTSLIRAGLLPRLIGAGFLAVYCRSFKDPTSTLIEQCEEQTRITQCTGEEIIDYLRRISLTSPRGLVIVFDQFEEFFINFRSAASRLAFTSLIADCSYERNLPVRFLFAVRKEFLPEIGATFDEQIAEPLAKANRYHLKLFDEHQAAEVIEKSIRRANWRFETGLIKRVARDLAFNDAVFPSELQIVGEQLQNKRIFTCAGYERAGGKEQLVQNCLEDAIAQTGDKETAHLILRSMISDEDTRLPFSLSEIAKRAQRTERQVASALDIFVRRRLIRVIQDKENWRYELIHEYLIPLIHQATGQVMDARQQANKIFRRYLSDYSFDRRTRIPLRRVRFIKRYSDIERGSREQELLTRSVRLGSVSVIGQLLLLCVLIFCSVAFLSVHEEWQSTQLEDGHTAGVTRAVFSPDGKLLISTGEDGRVIVWDFIQRKHLAVLMEHSGFVYALSFSPDGRFFASGGYDGKVVLWDAKTFRAVHIAQQNGEVGGLTFSHDGQLLAWSAQNAIGINLWSVNDWQRLRQLGTDGGCSFCAITFSKDDKLVELGTSYGWDVSTGKKIIWDLRDQWSTIAFMRFANETRAFGVGSDGYVTFLDAPNSRVIARIKAHHDNGRAVAVSPDGRLLASGAENIVLWDASTHRKIVRLDYPSIVWSLTFSPDGRWLVSTHGDGSIVIWDPSEHERIANLREHTGPVRAVSYSRDGTLLASASEDRSLIIWDVQRGTKKGVLTGHENRITGGAFSPDGSKLYSTDFDGLTICWNLEDGKPCWKHLISPQGGNYSLAVSPNGRWVAVSRAIYDAETGRAMLSEPDKKYVGVWFAWGVSFSLDSKWLVYPSSVLGVWNTQTWQLRVHEWAPGESAPIVSFSPDNSTFATGSDKGEMRLWDVHTLKQTAFLGRQSNRIKGLAFSPNGTELVSISDDQTVALWDVKRRRLKTFIGSHAAPVVSIAFSPDGNQIACGTHDNKVRLYTRHSILWKHNADWIPAFVIR